MKALPNYREHPRRKRILAIIAGAVAGVLLVAFLVFWLLGTPTNKIVPQYDPALAIPAQEAGACFTAADGTVYSLSKLWTLKSSGADGNHIISLFVFRMIPVNNGVAYIVIDKLYYYEKGERTKIAENVQTIAQYQSQLIYATADGNLYCWNGAESSLLVSSRDKSPHTFYMLGNAIILFGILLLLCRVIPRISETDNQTEHSLKRVFFTCVLVLFVLWLPYYISMWPATIHGDFLMQVLQLFHYPTMLQHQLTSDGVNVLYSNDHPFLHTQLVGLFIKFGIKINNKALGYGMYTFLQMTAYIGGISAIITTLYKFGANHRILKAALGAYALFPVFPLYAIMVGGDSFFALFFLWFMVGILWIFKTQGEVLKNIKFDIFFAVIVFLMSASKNQGIYIALVTLVFCVICLKKYRIKILVTMFVPIFIFQFAYTGLLFKAARVSTVGKQEALSICFQQTARYVKYHGDEVTGEEEAAIKKVLAYKKLAKKYQPALSDPVKGTYKSEATSTDLKNYFKVWLQMGLKHPDEYFQAFFANTYGYYAPLFNSRGGLYLGLSTVRFYRSNRKWAQEMVPESFCDKVDFKEPKILSPIRERMKFLMGISYKIPIINWLYNPGVITWLILIAFFALWIKRKYFDMAAFLPVFLIVCVCLLSPRNDNLRYIYPACVLILGMLANLQGDR